jgi:hypothetical protein
VSSQQRQHCVKQCQPYPTWRGAGKIHWRNTLEQLDVVGPKSLGVCLLTSAFIGMVFTIQFIRCVLPGDVVSPRPTAHAPRLDWKREDEGNLDRLIFSRHSSTSSEGRISVCVDFLIPVLAARAGAASSSAACGICTARNQCNELL